MEINVLRTITNTTLKILNVCMVSKLNNYNIDISFELIKNTVDFYNYDNIISILKSKDTIVIVYKMSNQKIILIKF